MAIVQQGAVNLTALIVPDVTVQVVPPQTTLLNGVPTNLLGMVGTAQWGPVNSPVVFGNMTGFAQAFGAVQARTFDLGTVAAIAVQQGASNMVGVRVTDGTDTAASGVLYGPAAASASGAVRLNGNIPANGDTVTLGGTVTTWRTTVSNPNTEVLIAGTSSASSANLAAFINANPANNVNIAKFSAVAAGSTIALTAVTAGAAGNSLTVAATTTGATITAMTGGVDAVIGATLTARYSGTLGNQLTAAVSAGSKSGTVRLTVALPGLVPEVFDNLPTASAFWPAMVAAVNNGQTGLRGPSQLVVATNGPGTATPPLSTITFSGGTDGASGVTAAALVGVDSTTRTGMYALRGTGAGIAVLADCTDTTTWAAQAAYGLAEGTYMLVAGAAGQAISAAAAAKAAAGIDSYACKVMFGDWVYWLDSVNGAVRLVSPQAFVAGRLANLSPEQSSLNKPVYGVVGTQKSAANQIYSAAELQQLVLAGIGVITNPIPAGAMFGCRTGRNSSSDSRVWGDNYTRMTNYLAATLNAGMGRFIGQVQSTQPDDPVRADVAATLGFFLQNMRQQRQIDDFSVKCDLTNNPPSRIALGYLQADVQVRYLGIVEYLIVNMEGGQSVTVTRRAA